MRSVGDSEAGLLPREPTGKGDGMELSINQLLALEYVKSHATESMTPEQFAQMYDKVLEAICRYSSTR